MFKRRANIQIYSVSPILSKTIKQCRCTIEMSTEELAKAIHKSTEYVIDLEQAKIAIDSQTLEDCALVFGLSPSQMVEIALNDYALSGAKAPNYMHMPTVVAVARV